MLTLGSVFGFAPSSLQKTPSPNGKFLGGEHKRSCILVEPPLLPYEHFLLQDSDVGHVFKGRTVR